MRNYIFLLFFFIFPRQYIVAQADTNYQWTWVNGVVTIPEKQFYGVQGVASEKNTPGARTKSISWTDKSGNLWLFGGIGFRDNNFEKISLNDLWKYDHSNNQWIWVSGDSTGNIPAVFGIRGTADAKNNPGSRQSSSSWVDQSGNFWLFGGGEVPSNDLWKYDISINQWTWVSGDSSGNAPLVYGTKGIPSAGNNPGARNESTFWTDKAGKFWLWGGNGVSNDLWKYDPLSDLWTWVSGDNISYASSVYGTQGVPNINNRPGGRERSLSWTDASGNLWLFGGYKDQGLRWPSGFYNDLWKFDIAASQWTWVKGDSTVDMQEVHDAAGIASFTNKPSGGGETWTDHSGNLWLLNYGLWKYDTNTNMWTWYRSGLGVYGVQGKAWDKNYPTSRGDGKAWVDTAGNFWLFGGNTVSPTSESGNYYNSNLLNDLWKYDIAAGQWIWMKGGNSHNNPIEFGTKGVAAITNNPDAGFSTVRWTDNFDNLWIFGGNDYNDLWKYDPLVNMWTWVKGDGKRVSAGLYGTKGISNPDNNPCNRVDGMSWKDKQGNLWFFGGTRNFAEPLNDLWKYSLQSNQWTWMKGDSTVRSPGIYGNKGVASLDNVPGARWGGLSWTDPSGNFWLFGGFGPGRVLNDLWKYDPLTNKWTWVNGDSTENGRSIYGIRGVAAPQNKPGPRFRGMSWSDNKGNLWLFGGQVEQLVSPANYNYVDLNDLWKYNTATNQWTWMKRDSSSFVNGVFQPVKGVYGTMGTGAFENTPYPSEMSATWTDNTGNLWLWGGTLYSGPLAGTFDLWKYDPALNQWAWMLGDSTKAAQCEYGIQGISSAQNNPGARVTSVSWTDSKGNCWLFGGYGGYRDIQLFYYDLWKINIPFVPLIQDTTTNLDSTAVNALNLKMFPNPTTKIVAISTVANTGSTLDIKVFNMNGIQLRSLNSNSTRTEIDMSPYPAGAYIILVEDKQKKSRVKKIIIKE